MRLLSIPLVLASLLSLTVEQIQAQEPRADSATYARANKPVFRWKEILGVTATTGIALALDQTIRDELHDPHDALGRTLSDIGNGFGDGVIVYSTLLGLSVGGKVLSSTMSACCASVDFGLPVMATSVTPRRLITGSRLVSSST